MRPTLVAVAHGTRGATGRQQIRDLVAAVARRRPGLDVRLGFAPLGPDDALLGGMLRHLPAADAVTPPLCADPVVADPVLRRYEAALLTTAPGRM
jgi:hypothetical protein